MTGFTGNSYAATKNGAAFVGIGDMRLFCVGRNSAISLMGLLVALPAHAGASLDLSAPVTLADSSAPQTPVPQAAPEVGPMQTFFDNWFARSDAVKASQPEFSSPLITTNPILEQRYRFDVPIDHIGNGSDTTNLDGGKGLDLIVGDTQEIQVGLPPYTIHSTPTGKGDYSGWADWPVFRFKQRLLSSPADQGNYVLSAWLQIQVPTGIQTVTNHAVTLLPTIGGGKGFGHLSILFNTGAAIPTAYEGKLGIQLTQNIAFEYALFPHFTPTLEFNNTVWSNGQRDGLDQLFITPGVNIGHIPIAKGLNMTLAAGYQTAVTPKFQAKPLLPAYDHAWIMSTRFNF